MQLRRFFFTCLALSLVFLLLFGLFAALGLETALERVLAEPSRAGAATAGLGVLLLVADVFLPVPSSVVMLLFGRTFGVAIGTALSLAGGIGAAALGMLVGRFARGAFRRLVREAEYERASRLLERFGLLAIMATRPIPIVAETVTLVAGATGMPVGRCLLAATLGSLPSGIAYAWAGARDLSAPGGFIAFSGILLLSCATYLLGRRLSGTAPPG